MTGQAQEGAGLGVVETAYGQAQGVPGALDGITLFKGVPYEKSMSSKRKTQIR